MFYRKTIKQYETGLLWRKGQIVGIVKPGRYWVTAGGKKITTYDMRDSALRIPGQEVILGDRTSLKINVAGTYAIADPKRMILAVPALQLADYLNQTVQLRLRDVLAENTLDTLLEKRNEVSKALFEALQAEFEKVGLTLKDIRVKDVILPSDLRAAYTESLSAKLRAAAQLEQARGQSAALRNLANTADLLEKHPQLLQLLTLQKKDGILNLYFNQSVVPKAEKPSK